MNIYKTKILELKWYMQQIRHGFHNSNTKSN